MSSNRIKAAAEDIEAIDAETSEEMEELRDAIDEVEDLHEEHLEEMRRDEEFIEEMKDLYEEIETIKQIEHHMYQLLEAYDNGEIAAQEFKKRFIHDKERFVEAVGEVTTDLEEIIMLISEEERLTNKDLDREGGIEELIRALNHQEGELEDTHEHMEQVLFG